MRPSVLGYEDVVYVNVISLSLHRIKTNPEKCNNPVSVDIIALQETPL